MTTTEDRLQPVDPNQGHEKLWRAHAQRSADLLAGATAEAQNLPNTEALSAICALAQAHATLALTYVTYATRAGA